jgi:hypothetical protein
MHPCPIFYKICLRGARPFDGYASADRHFKWVLCWPLLVLQDTVSALIEALLDYTGGILVVSHDEHLITAVCDTLWIAGEGTVRHSKGDFQDYKRQCLG